MSDTCSKVATPAGQAAAAGRLAPETAQPAVHVANCLIQPGREEGEVATGHSGVNITGGIEA